MHDEVSETENLRKNLAVERMIVEGCDILLDVNQVFVRQGKIQIGPLKVNNSGNYFRPFSRKPSPSATGPRADSLPAGLLQK